jgi:hypothetical protein
MKRISRSSNDPPTPVSNRERILALEAHIARLDKTVDQHQRDLDIQLQRIAQIQADLDAIRTAWTKATKGSRRAVTSNMAGPHALR